MYLKKIIASGFKSFADNTILDLDKNITGVPVVDKNKNLKGM